MWIDEENQRIKVVNEKWRLTKNEGQKSKNQGYYGVKKTPCTLFYHKMILTLLESVSLLLIASSMSHDTVIDLSVQGIAFHSPLSST